jgi:hypothetical protein
MSQSTAKTFFTTKGPKEHEVFLKELCARIQNCQWRLSEITCVSSLDKIGGGLALEQNRPLVETWGYEYTNIYQREH